MSADTSSGSGGCVSCSDPAPCACSAGESCLQLAATCDTCPRNICTADSSSSSSDAGSGAGNTGAKAGGAVAAVLVIALLCAAAWYFLRTRKRERQRAAFIANARRQSSALKAQAHKGGAQDDARVGKRSSVHLGIVHPGEQHELSRRERHAPRQSVPTVRPGRNTVSSHTDNHERCRRWTTRSRTPRGTMMIKTERTAMEQDASAGAAPWSLSTSTGRLLPLPTTTAADTERARAQRQRRRKPTTRDSRRAHCSRSSLASVARSLRLLLARL